MNAAELLLWAATAKAGESAVYHNGFLARDDTRIGVCAMALGWSEMVCLVQKKVCDGVYTYIAQRTSKPFNTKDYETARVHKPWFENGKSSMPRKESDLTQQVHQFAWDMKKAGEKITQAEIARRMKVNKETVRRHMMMLIDRNVMSRQGSAYSVTWDVLKAPEAVE